MSTVLVTGGAGYIGSHAVKALRAAGHAVVVYDDLSAGHRAAVRGAPLVEGDVRDTRRLADALRGHGAAAVMHFAALLSVEESVRDPARYYEHNVRGGLSVLEAMRAGGASRLVLSSSCAVYGNPVATPIGEDHPTDPINAYGDSKLAVERALRHYGRAYGVRSIALRYFNAAGADPDGDLGEDHAPEIHLIPRALEAVRGGAPLRVFGGDYPTADGTCQRDFVHVSDIADAHVRALDALGAGDGEAARVYNLGTGAPHSVREVIRSVERVTGRRVPAEPAPRRPGDPPVLFAAAGRIGRDLDWRPAHTELDDIVATAWRWHERHPEGFGSTA